MWLFGIEHQQHKHYSGRSSLSEAAVCWRGSRLKQCETQSLFFSALPRLSGLHLKIAEPFCVREAGRQGGVRLSITAALHCIWTLSFQRLLLKISLGHSNARIAPRWALWSAWNDAEFGSGGVQRKWITRCSQCVTIRGEKTHLHMDPLQHNYLEFASFTVKTGATFFFWEIRFYSLFENQISWIFLLLAAVENKECLNISAKWK